MCICRKKLRDSKTRISGAYHYTNGDGDCIDLETHKSQIIYSSEMITKTIRMQRRKKKKECDVNNYNTASTLYNSYCVIFHPLKDCSTSQDSANDDTKTRFS